ncbi:FAD-dependent oxidoreductase [Sinorhizobium meliloti]|uniref:flavin monoamine oxidase family protein n=1 Tax=Rhizobium meliloti TaxID=382 RepID=UPI003F180589
MTMPTRADLLQLAQAAGGDAAAYSAAMALQLVNTERADRRPSLPSDFGRGNRIVILGAGIAGMIAAYELRKAGFSVTVLESRPRAGGRILTVRGGDTLEEIDSSQSVLWDQESHLYFNAGPARLPQHHTEIVGYCRELGVPLEVMINDNRGAYFQDAAAFGGIAQRSRAVINDIRGFVAELAYKSVNPASFEQPVSLEDLDQIRNLLIEFGALDRRGRYCGSERIGHREPLGAGFQNESDFNIPLEFRELLRSDFWRHKSNFGELLDSAATILQPVGGMDKISDALSSSLGNLILYNAQVVRLERTDDGARVVWRQSGSEVDQVFEAPYVICTIPFPVLQKIPADFSPAVKVAMPRVEYINGGKVAFQARRFWETEHSIYGGISWTSEQGTQVWYPSHGLHREKGILVGAFIQTSAAGEAFADLSLEGRLAMALRGGERIHPGFSRKAEGGVSISWKKVPHSMGGWAHWEPDTRSEVYPHFVEPDGPFYFAGEHISNMTGWQEGAIRSVFFMISKLAERVASHSDNHAVPAL